MAHCRTLLALALALGCGSDTGRPGAGATGLTTLTGTASDTAGVTASSSGSATDTTGSDDGTGDGGGIKLDVADGNPGATAGDDKPDCPEGPPPADATLRGTVYTPNLEIPISGALIYTASSEPEGVPDGVYCSECRAVECSHRFVLSEADGSFELPAVSGPGQWLVVTKGEFFHATPLDIAAGDTNLDPVTSSLPGEWNPAEGHYIPRMAVMASDFDRIFNILAKIGLGEVDVWGEMVPGTGKFDVLADANALLNNPGAMDKYHIIFMPCQGTPGLTLGAGQSDNIRAWTEKGGKWYVTDWANEYMYEPFPGYQTFHQPDQPDLAEYDSEATILDPDLLAWLQALPAPLKDVGGGLPTLLNLPTVTMEDNWSGLDQTPEIIVQDMDGMDVNVGHYPWVEGPCHTCLPTDVRPMTVTGRYGCGRILFSTYHTNEVSHLGLTPQELVLLYIILEIGVCHDKPPPPTPPQG